MNHILVSVHSLYPYRENALNKNNDDSLKDEIAELVRKEFKETNEKQKEYGQNVSETFPRAHLFVNTEINLSKQ